MDLGLTIFATDQSMDIVELAREAEARGFTSLWTLPTRLAARLQKTETSGN